MLTRGESKLVFDIIFSDFLEQFVTLNHLIVTMDAKGQNVCWERHLQNMYVFIRLFTVN